MNKQHIVIAIALIGLVFSNFTLGEVINEVGNPSTNSCSLSECLQFLEAQDGIMVPYNELKHKVTRPCSVNCLVGELKTQENGLRKYGIPTVEPICINNSSYANTFGMVRKLRPHHGWDLASPLWSPVFAISHSKVYRKGFMNGYGKYVLLQDFVSSYYFLYAHLNSITVSDNDILYKRMQLGTSGNSGNATYSHPHLHFEIWLNPTLGVGQTNTSLDGRESPIIIYGLPLLQKAMNCF